MDERSSKEKILKKVRKALLQQDVFFKSKLDLETDVFAKEDENLPESFAQNFINNNGKFIYCYHSYHFIDQFLSVFEKLNWENVIVLEEWLKNIFRACDFHVFAKPEDVKQAEVGITGCDALIARTGSVIMTSGSSLSRSVSVFPPVHIVVAFRNQMLYDLKHFFAAADVTRSSMTSIVCGPSRTADIEKTLVLGAHGPRQMYVFYIDEERNFD